MKRRDLAKDYGEGSDVHSVTSFTELARDGQDRERWRCCTRWKLCAFRTSLR
ncbi:hypothetical protein ACNKHM_07130 [Shigella sonnei]